VTTGHIQKKDIIGNVRKMNKIIMAFRKTLYVMQKFGWKKISVF